ncbi:RecB family exonuclease [Nocardia bovistercoris]|uniref:PD-(D/E)XK nuclease family protein n=1 Tax=Nocardia bovistercoris TaxID=2785916 RepID=A0A931I4E0_9NOCA|nr:RecB family exonuclease [Nocardia bovistercoris]MBH0774674.1 PD-(D/E)XK nuclease family protein [Nocardia bovistercoris]
MSVPASTPPADTANDPGAAGSGAPRRPALSPSRAMDFKQCPLKYRLRAIDRIPEQPSRHAVRGTVVHAVLEDLYGLPAAERSPERADTLVAPAWDRTLADSPEIAELVADDGLEPFLAEVRELLVAYYRLEDPTRFDPESREQLVEVELGDGVLLRGFVDRIDLAPTGQLRVVDYKTGRAPGPNAETRALFQLKFYALVVLRTRGILPAQLRLIYLADEQILTYAPDEEELLRFERTLSALWEAIVSAGRSGDFRPNPGWLCGFCDYKAMCPEFGGTPPPYPGWPGGATESPEETSAESVAQ